MKPAITAAAALTLATGANLAAADIVNVFGDPTTTTNSTPTGATFEAVVEYNALSADTAQLAIQLTNATTPDIGGFLTGFGFIVPTANPGLDIALSSATDPDLLLITDFSVANLGTFDGGAALRADFNGGGKPSDGIAAGDTALFVFDITGFLAAGLDAQTYSVIDFVNNGDAFVARFRGLEDGGSEKIVGTTEDPILKVPTPGTASLALAALGMTATRRRRSA